MRFYKQLATHTIYQVIARIASSGSSFLITFFVARHYGVMDYGDFAKVTAFVSIFYLFVDIGLNAVFLQKEHAQQRFRDLFYTRLALSGVVVFLANVLSFALPYNSVTGIGFSPTVRLGIAVFSMTLITESILFSAFAAFQQKRIYQRFMYATVIGSLITLIAVLCFGVLGLPLVFIFLAFVIGATVEAWLSLVYTDEKLFPFQVNTTFIKSLLYETFPVTLMLVFNLIYFRIDMILLSLFKSSVDVALYDISYRVFDFLLALPLFLSNVLYPKLIQDQKNNRNATPKLLQYVAIFAMFGFVVAVPTWFIAPLLFVFIKPQLAQAVIPMHLLLLFLPVFFVTNILQWILLTKKKQIVLAWIYAGLTVSNIILNIVFIPHYSYVASAIITGVSETIVASIMFWLLFL